MAPAGYRNILGADRLRWRCLAIAPMAGGKVSKWMKTELERPAAKKQGV